MWQSFYYRLKIQLNNKALLFWTLLFPMILSIFFNLALRDVYANEQLTAIHVGTVVKDSAMSSILDTLETEHGLIKQTQYSTYDDAVNALKSGAIEGIVTDDTALKLTLPTGSHKPEVTVVSNVIDSINMKQALIVNVAKENSGMIPQGFVQGLLDDTQYIKANNNMNAADLSAIHFYTTIAMMCIYASEWGLRSGQYLQADQTPVGIRNNISPVRKGKIIRSDLSVIYFIFCVEFIIHLSFLRFVLDIPFGNNPSLIILTGLVGGFLSCMLGYMLCVSIKGSDGKKSVIISMAGVFLSFLSGMMSVQIKYMLDSISPLFSKLNPASLITDNFYWIFRGTNTNVVYQNIGIMVVMSVVFGVIAYRKMRGVVYDSL